MLSDLTLVEIFSEFTLVEIFSDFPLVKFFSSSEFTLIEKFSEFTPTTPEAMALSRTGTYINQDIGNGTSPILQIISHSKFLSKNGYLGQIFPSKMDTWVNFPLENDHVGQISPQKWTLG